MWAWSIKAGAVGRTVRQEVLLYALPALGIAPSGAPQPDKHFCSQSTSLESPGLLKPVAKAGLPFALSFYPVRFSEWQTSANRER